MLERCCLQSSHPVSGWNKRQGLVVPKLRSKPPLHALVCAQDIAMLVQHHLAQLSGLPLKHVWPSPAVYGWRGLVQPQHALGAGCIIQHSFTLHISCLLQLSARINVLSRWADAATLGIAAWRDGCRSAVGRLRWVAWLQDTGLDNEEHGISL